MSKLAVLAIFVMDKEIEFSLAMRSHWKIQTWLLPPSNTDAVSFQDLDVPLEELCPYQFHIPWNIDLC